GAAAKVEAVRTLLGVTWERTGHRLRVNEQDTLAEFTLTYRELIFAQSTGSLDHPAVVEQSIRVSVNTPGQDGTGPQRPLSELRLSYAAAIDKDEETDLRGFYDTTVLPWLIQNLRDVSGGRF